jgi:polyisoprenoid-binding protein YceI
VNSTIKKLLLGAGALVVAAIGALVVYNVFIKEEPARLDFTDTTATTAPANGATTGGASTTTTTATGATTAPAGVDGTWKVATGTEFGYRVKEDFAGGLADQTAIGRTSAVTGTLTVAGTKATAVDLTADLTQLKSDQSRRDTQVQTRILTTAQFPKATFVLTSPIEFSKVPEIGAELPAKATGDLTIHGTKKSVSFDLTAKRTTATEVQVIGAIAMTWSDYSGEMEFRLVLGR